MTCRKSNSDGSRTDYYTITLNDCLISSYSISGTENQSGGDKPMESISLNFTKITVKSIPEGQTFEDNWRAK